MKLQNYLLDFFHILLPKLCSACDKSLLAHEELICTECAYHLPFTDFHFDENNESARQLWGKLDAVFAYSMLYLSKSSRVEKLMHKLKYDNQPEIGVYLGKLYGKKLLRDKVSMDIDMIVPIPLHQSKFRKRGYNQATCFAEGLSEVLNISVENNLLMRSVASASQTTKSRLDRYDNVHNVFKINPKYQLDLMDKSILLVDDILTTGATIVEAGNVLNERGARVSVMTIARS